MSALALLDGVSVAVRPGLAPAALAGELLSGLGARQVADGPADICMTASGGAHHPAEVTVTISGYGPGDPSAGSRMLPLWSPVGVGVAETIAAVHAAIAAVAGLRWARLREDRVDVDVAAFRALAALLGDLREPSVLRRGGAAPRLLDARDGIIGAQLPTAEDRACAGAMVGLAVPDDVALTGELARWAARRSRAEAVAEAQDWRLAFVSVPGRDEARPAAGPPLIEIAGTGANHEAAVAGDRPLAGVRVADLGHVWAGPYAGRLLASMGADVIKIEAPRRPDGTRRGGFAMFETLNRGKRSAVLDLTAADGRDTFAALLAGCDALIENFSRRVMPALGLGPAELAEIRPGIVAFGMPAFAPGGAAAEWVAYGSGLELHAGLSGWTPEGRPEVASVPYLDMLSGAFAALGTVAALLRRDATAAGAVLNVVQADVAALVGRTGLAPGAPQGAAAEDPRMRIGESTVELRPGGPLLARAPWSFAGDRGARGDWLEAAAR